MFQWKKHTLCVVVGDGFEDFAIDAVREDGRVLFYTLSHRRSLGVVAVVADEPDRFDWIDERNRRYELTPMTVKRYNAMRSKGARAVGSMEELRAILDVVG